MKVFGREMSDGFLMGEVRTCTTTVAVDTPVWPHDLYIG